MTASQRRRPAPPLAAAKPIELRVRGDFLEWLARSGGSLAVTTYNSGKLALLSAPAGVLVARFWSFPRPMGLACDGPRLALASRDHLWVFRSAPPRLVLDAVHATGRIDAHDIALDRRGLLVANTRFNCIVRPRDSASFRRVWQPPFIAGAVRTDACHLNGLAVRAGRLAAATAFCERDAPRAWRDGDRFHSGVFLDVRRNTVAARGLCMPHSPRWHAGRWWFCDSGHGTLARLDRRAGRGVAVAALPGFTRGLAFAAGRALVGLSRIRRRHILDAPPVRERFPRMRSGVWLVDPAAGRVTGAIEFTRGGREVYDVAFLPDLVAAELTAAAEAPP